jgi:hypothetical protein
MTRYWCLSLHLPHDGGAPKQGGKKVELMEERGNVEINTTILMVEF